MITLRLIWETNDHKMILWQFLQQVRGSGYSIRRFNPISRLSTASYHVQSYKNWQSQWLFFMYVVDSAKSLKLSSSRRCKIALLCALLNNGVLFSIQKIFLGVVLFFCQLLLALQLHLLHVPLPSYILQLIQWQWQNLLNTLQYTVSSYYRTDRRHLQHRTGRADVSCSCCYNSNIQLDCPSDGHWDLVRRPS